MQTQDAIKVLEALIIITNNPEMTLAKAVEALRNLAPRRIGRPPASDAISPVTYQFPSPSKPAEPVKSRFLAVGKKKPGPKPGSKPGKKKIGRPRKDAQK